jgi:hypothetical protein
MKFQFIRQHEGHDLFVVQRKDGSSVSAEMPREDLLPRPLVVFTIENALGLKGGFVDLLAAGHSPGNLMERDLGPDLTSEAFLWAQALTDCFLPELWDGGEISAEGEPFEVRLEMACAGRGIDPRPLSDDDAQVIREMLRDALDVWPNLEDGAGIAVELP